LILAYSSYV